MDKPFAILQDWVKEGRIHLSPQPVIDDEPREIPIEPLPDGLSDDALFEHAERVLFLILRLDLDGWPILQRH